MIALGGGVWAPSQAAATVATPASYSMPTLGTQVALALRANTSEEQAQPRDIPREVAVAALGAGRASHLVSEVEDSALQAHSYHSDGLANMSIALASGDIIIAAVALGGLIRVRDACEGLKCRSNTRRGLQSYNLTLSASAQLGILLRPPHRLTSRPSLARCGTTSVGGIQAMDSEAKREHPNPLGTTQSRPRPMAP